MPEPESFETMRTVVRLAAFAKRRLSLTTASLPRSVSINGGGRVGIAAGLVTVS